jgi:ABC-type dipeptide/oligopeptide/nickel transport system permease component
MLNVVMLCVSMPSVVTLNAIMLSVVVPMEGLPNTLAYYSQLQKWKVFWQTQEEVIEPMVTNCYCLIKALIQLFRDSLRDKTVDFNEALPTTRWQQYQSQV